MREIILLARDITRELTNVWVVYSKLVTQMPNAMPYL